MRTTFRQLIIVGCLFAAACAPALPDDVPGLIQQMGSGSRSIRYAAAKRMSARYGKEGLLRALHEGRPDARGMAAFQLRDFPDAETEQRLMWNVEQDPEPYVRVQALWTLQDIGTERALPVVEKATVDPSPLAATTARAAVAAIRERMAHPPGTAAAR